MTISSVSGATAPTYTPATAPAPPTPPADDPQAVSGHHHHHHGGGGGNSAGKLQDLSDALGTDPDSLLSQLTSGDSSAVEEGATPYSSASELPTSGLVVDQRA